MLLSTRKTSDIILKLTLLVCFVSAVFGSDLKYPGLPNNNQSCFINVAVQLVRSVPFLKNALLNDTNSRLLLKSILSGQSSYQKQLKERDVLDSKLQSLNQLLNSKKNTHKATIALNNLEAGNVQLSSEQIEDFKKSCRRVLENDADLQAVRKQVEAITEEKRPILKFLDDYNQKRLLLSLAKIIYILEEPIPKTSEALSATKPHILRMELSQINANDYEVEVRNILMKLQDEIRSLFSNADIGEQGSATELFEFIINAFDLLFPASVNFGRLNPVLSEDDLNTTLRLSEILERDEMKEVVFQNAPAMVLVELVHPYDEKVPVSIQLEHVLSVDQNDYFLMGIVSHTGENGVGHLFCHIKNVKRPNVWTFFDDEEEPLDENHIRLLHHDGNFQSFLYVKREEILKYFGVDWTTLVYDREYLDACLGKIEDKIKKEEITSQEALDLK